MKEFAQARVISSTVLKLWIREVARATGASTRIVITGAGVAFVLALVLGALLALVASSQLQGDTPPGLRAAVLRTSFSGAALTGGAIGVVLCMSMPPRTALQNLVDLVPVGQVTARLGEITPLIVGGLVYSLALSTTGAAIVVRTTTDIWTAGGGLAAYSALVVVALVISVGTFMVAQYISARFLKLPAQYSATFGGVVAFAATLATTVPDILASKPVLEFTWSLGELLPSRAFAWAATGQPWALLGVVCWIIAAVSLLWFGARLRAPNSRNRQPRWLHGVMPVRRSAWWGQIWFETLLAVRNPQFTMTMLLLPIPVAAIYALSLLPEIGTLAGQLGLSVAVFPLMLALYSAGRTLPSTWIGRAAGARAAVRIAAKPIAVVATSGLLSFVVVVALLSLSLAQTESLVDVVARCLLALSLALTVGTLIPYSEQQPLSIVAAGFVLAVVYLLASLGIGIATQGAASEVPTLITLAVAVIALGAYALLGVRTMLTGPVRA